MSAPDAAQAIASTLAAVLVLLLAPALARAAPLIDPPDAAELAQTLAEATAEQRVCYGWQVTVDDQSGGGSGGLESGSSAGPGAPLDRRSCPRWVVLEGSVVYTSESSESEDDAGLAIASNLPRPPTVGQLEELGYGAGSLLGESDDQAIIDMTGALPLLVAETGAAPYIPFEPPAQPIPASDRPDAGPGSDWLRNYWWVLPLGLGGAVALVVALVRARSAMKPRRPRKRPPPGPNAEQGASA